MKASIKSTNQNNIKKEETTNTMNFCGICRQKVCPGDKNRLPYTRVDGSMGWIHGVCFVKAVKKNVGEVTDVYDEQLRAIEGLALLVTDPVKEQNLYERYQKLLDIKYQEVFMHDVSSIQKHLKELTVSKGYDKTDTLETVLDRCEKKIYQETDKLLKTNNLVWFENVQKLMALVSVSCDVCITKLSIRRQLFDQARLDQIREQMKYFKN